MKSRRERELKELLKLEVLELIQQNNKVLFAYCKRNNQAMKAKADGWTLILRKAQSLGLAPNAGSWTYARDRLFSFWKTQLNSKQKRASITGKPLKMTKVDEAIIEIVVAHPKFCREHRIYELYRNILQRNNVTQGPQPGGDNIMVRNRQWQVEHPQLPQMELPINFYMAKINSPRAEINYPSAEFAQVLNEAQMILNTFDY